MSDVSIDDPDKIDSSCEVPQARPPGDTTPPCNDYAVVYVFARDGRRKYLCETHAEEVDRFDDVDVTDHPRIVSCKKCNRLTPYDLAPLRVCPDCQ